MTNEQKENMKKELWFNVFTQQLFNKNLLSDDQKLKIEQQLTH